MSSQPAIADLTGREYEILQHVALGRSNAAIAGQLGISTYTVRNHLSNIFEKVGAQSRWHAVTLVFPQRCLSDFLKSVDPTPPWSGETEASPAYTEQVA